MALRMPFQRLASVTEGRISIRLALRGVPKSAAIAA